jgi:hypothetical protein
VGRVTLEGFGQRIFSKRDERIKQIEKITHTMNFLWY